MENAAPVAKAVPEGKTRPKSSDESNASCGMNDDANTANTSKGNPPGPYSTPAEGPPITPHAPSHPQWHSDTMGYRHPSGGGGGPGTTQPQWEEDLMQALGSENPTGAGEPDHEHTAGDGGMQGERYTLRVVSQDGTSGAVRAALPGSNKPSSDQTKAIIAVPPPAHSHPHMYPGGRHSATELQEGLSPHHSNKDSRSGTGSGSLQYCPPGGAGMDMHMGTYDGGDSQLYVDGPGPDFPMLMPGGQGAMHGGIIPPSCLAANPLDTPRCGTHMGAPVPNMSRRAQKRAMAARAALAVKLNVDLIPNLADLSGLPQPVLPQPSETHLHPQPSYETYSQEQSLPSPSHSLDDSPTKRQCVENDARTADSSPVNSADIHGPSLEQSLSALQCRGVSAIHAVLHSNLDMEFPEYPNPGVGPMHQCQELQPQQRKSPGRAGFDIDSLDDKKKARVLANRASAARSKEKQRIQQQRIYEEQNHILLAKQELHACITYWQQHLEEREQAIALITARLTDSEREAQHMLLQNQQLQLDNQRLMEQLQQLRAQLQQGQAQAQAQAQQGVAIVPVTPGSTRSGGGGGASAPTHILRTPASGVASSIGGMMRASGGGLPTADLGPTRPPGAVNPGRPSSGGSRWAGAGGPLMLGGGNDVAVPAGMPAPGSLAAYHSAAAMLSLGANMGPFGQECGMVSDGRVPPPGQRLQVVGGPTNVPHGVLDLGASTQFSPRSASVPMPLTHAAPGQGMLQQQHSVPGAHPANMMPGPAAAMSPAVRQDSSSVWSAQQHMSSEGMHMMVGNGNLVHPGQAAGQVHMGPPLMGSASNMRGPQMQRQNSALAPRNSVVMGAAQFGWGVPGGEASSNEQVPSMGAEESVWMGQRGPQAGAQQHSGSNSTSHMYAAFPAQGHM